MNKRKSNIELMRIVCIILVIMHHYYVHGTWNTGGGYEPTPGNQTLLRAMGMGGKLAINCFVLITGYFGVSATTNVKKKIIQLCADRWFYSMLISAVMLGIGWYTVSINYVLRALFPILTCRHNYMTTFIMLYLCIPFLNKFIKSVSKEEMRNFCILLTVLISIIPSVLTLTKLYTNNVYSYLAWMLYIYCLGAYIRLYEPALPWKLISGGSILLMLFMVIVAEPNWEWLPIGYTTTQHNILMLIASVSIFCVFLKIKIGYNKFINFFASSTLAVLLIHDDPLVRGVIWTKIFNNAAYGGSQYLLLHEVTTVFLIYLFCVLVDNMYRLVIKRMIFRLWRSNFVQAFIRKCGYDYGIKGSVKK